MNEKINTSRKLVLKSTAILLFVLINIWSFAQEIPTPTSHFGFKPGTDRMLFNYDPLISYFKKLDDVSDKMKMMEIGESPMGKKMYVAFISSSENIQNLERLKEINKMLATNPNLSKDELDQALSDGSKAFGRWNLE